MHSRNSEMITLGSLIDTRKGYAFKSKWFQDHGVPVVKVKNFTTDSVDTSNLVNIPTEIAREFPGQVLHTDDVIVQTVGSWPSNPASVVGKVVRIPRSADGSLLNQNAVKLIPNKNVDQRYLFYLLKDSRFKDYIIGTAQGAASQASITLDSLRSFKLSLPSLATQHRISSILSAYDDLIENNTRRIAILEEMARRLYQEWFVHFRFPGHDKVKLVDSELGEIPEGWSLGKLKDYVELAYGKALKADDREEGPYPVFGSSGIVGTHSASMVEGPGIIVGRKGNVGSVHWSDEAFWPIDTVYFVRTDLSLFFVFFNLMNQNFLNNDAAVPGLNRNQAYSLPFLLSDQALVTAFDSVCAPLFAQHRILRLKNENLRTQRDLLLPKLISGEIDVSALPATEESAAA